MGTPVDAATVEADVLHRYVAFSRFNSPYPAHEAGHAIDLYPAEGSPSPVAGRVTRTLTVRAPDRPYASDYDHLITIDVGDHVARVLHVDPAVEPGDDVDIGDPLGELVRSGYFAPWVDNHLHLGFRPPDVDHRRASGSLPIRIDVPVEPVSWVGRGTVVERGTTYVTLDAPTHPSVGDRFAGIAAQGGGVLDGGLPHYSGGGIVDGSDGPVALGGTRVGIADRGRVAWDGVEVRANGTPVDGLSFACRRDRLGVKLVSMDGIPAALGEQVEVEIRSRRREAV